MRRFLGVLALSFWASVAFANTSAGTQTVSLSQSQQQSIDSWLDSCGEQFENWWYSTVGAVFGLTDPDSSSGGVVAAPEFDPPTALAALTLLSGGLAVLRGRRGKR